MSIFFGWGCYLPPTFQNHATCLRCMHAYTVCSQLYINFSFWSSLFRPLILSKWAFIQHRNYLYISDLFAISQACNFDISISFLCWLFKYCYQISFLSCFFLFGIFFLHWLEERKRWKALQVSPVVVIYFEIYKSNHGLSVTLDVVKCNILNIRKKWRKKNEFEL